MKYKYELHRASMPRNGGGDLYLNFGARPRIRLQGVAHSPKFGKGNWAGRLEEKRSFILDNRSYQKFLVEGGFVMEFDIATGFYEFDWNFQPRPLF